MSTNNTLSNCETQDANDKVNIVPVLQEVRCRDGTRVPITAGVSHRRQILLGNVCGGEGMQTIHLIAEEIKSKETKPLG